MEIGINNKNFFSYISKNNFNYINISLGQGVATKKKTRTKV